MALGAIATQSFQINNANPTSICRENVPFNLYSEGQLDEPWGFPSHDHNETLVEIINNTGCDIEFYMSFDGKDTEGNEFGGTNIHIDVNSGQTSVITYGNVRSIIGLGTTVLEINYAVLSFKFPTWDRFISQGPGTIKYSIEGPCDCVFVRFDQHARKIYFDKCK